MPANLDSIAYTATVVRGAGKSLHQCMLVTLSGTNLNFLNDSVVRNMDFDHASLLSREAQISLVGLKPISPEPRDVYLAVEKINMPRNNSAGYSEGPFLDASMKRLISRGGNLAEVLQSVQAQLSDGDAGSLDKLDAILEELRRAAIVLDYRDMEEGKVALNRLTEVLRGWLLDVKPNAATTTKLAAVLIALDTWLNASGSDSLTRLTAFLDQLSQWLGNLGNDPASSQWVSQVAQALQRWLASLSENSKLATVIEVMVTWLNDNRSAQHLSAVLAALGDWIGSPSAQDRYLTRIIANSADAIARWLKGEERLDALVDALNEAGLGTKIFDQLFPTFRVHVYYDTGERAMDKNGKAQPVLQTQTSFGLYAYHEGGLAGWSAIIEGATRLAENFYVLKVPENGTAQVTTKIQGREPDENPIPEPPIVAPSIDPNHKGCLEMIVNLLLGRK